MRGVPDAAVRNGSHRRGHLNGRGGHPVAVTNGAMRGLIPTAGGQNNPRRLAGNIQPGFRANPDALELLIMLLDRNHQRDFGAGNVAGVNQQVHQIDQSGRAVLAVVIVLNGPAADFHLSGVQNAGISVNHPALQAGSDSQNLECRARRVDIGNGPVLELFGRGFVELVGLIGWQDGKSQKLPRAGIHHNHRTPARMRLGDPRRQFTLSDILQARINGKIDI